MFGPTREAAVRLREDTDHGATHLAREALDALARHAAEAPASTPAELRSSLREAAHALADARPSMVPVTTRVGALLHVLGVHARDRVEEDAEDVEALRDACAFHAEATRAAASQAHDATVQAAVGLLEDANHVTTLSRSGTVLAALKDARVPTTVLASHPGHGGQRMAELLVEAGVDATLTPASHGPRAALEADLVLVGADAVLADGTVRNSAGTHGLLLAAADAGTPGLVVADTWKIAPADHEADPEPVDGDPPPGVGWRATRFEEVPPRVVGALVNEHGTHPAGQAGRWLREAAWAALAEPS